jgi:hypothetical protein
MPAREAASAKSCAVGSGWPAASRVSDLAREIVLRVELHGSGEMTVSIAVEGAAVDETHDHNAPLSAIDRDSTRWSG